MAIERQPEEGSWIGRLQESGGSGEVEKPAVPWQPASPQEAGTQKEKLILRKRGYKAHPRSGAGRIKHDGSDAETLVEVKTARKSYTMQERYVAELHAQAVRQGKEPLLIVQFPAYVCEVTIRRV